MKRFLLNNFTIAFLLTLVSVSIYSFNLPFFKLLDLKAYDVKLTARGNRAVTNQVVIVGIDEKSLEQEGRWPWPRSKLARLIDQLSASGASVIGIDIFFPERDAYVPFETIDSALSKQEIQGWNSRQTADWLRQVGNSDRLFAQSLAKSDRSVLGYLVFPRNTFGEVKTETLNQKHLDLLDFSQYGLVHRTDKPEDKVKLPEIETVGMSLPEFMDAANNAGFVHYLPDRDGVVRRIPLVMSYANDYLFPPLSLQVLHEAQQSPLMINIAPYGVERVMFNKVEIPTTAEGDYFINYYGPAYTFRHISATDILAGRVPDTDIKGKIILLGATAAATYDMKTTPFGPLYPGVEAHATIIENVLQKDFIQRPPWIGLLDISIILASGIILGIINLFFRAIASGILALLGITAFLGFDYYLLAEKGLLIHTVYPVFSQLFVFSGVTIFRFAYEERKKRFIQGAFGHYLAPTVVQQVVDNPKLLKLGGDRKILTAFFSDIEGFSSISESLTPKQLVELLNEFLTEMTDILLANEGTVDKFQGDSIIAFFGAPLHYEDHATRACRAALGMQKRLAEMREVWKREGRHELHMRIGLNTGGMVVGNMGSAHRMDYTIMGDSVNLAARLEGVNKVYGSQILISEFTFKFIQEALECRELDRIRVVGKDQPVAIYEVLCEKGELDPVTQEAYTRFADGLALYRQKKWADAILLFEQCIEIKGEDRPSRTFIQRCEDFQKIEKRSRRGSDKGSIIPDDWDGVFSMRSK